MGVQTMVRNKPKVHVFLFLSGLSLALAPANLCAADEARERIALPEVPLETLHYQKERLEDTLSRLFTSPTTDKPDATVKVLNDKRQRLLDIYTAINDRYQANEFVDFDRISKITAQIKSLENSSYYRNSFGVVRRDIEENNVDRSISQRHTYKRDGKEYEDSYFCSYGDREGKRPIIRLINGTQEPNPPPLFHVTIKTEAQNYWDLGEPRLITCMSAMIHTPHGPLQYWIQRPEDADPEDTEYKLFMTHHYFVEGPFTSYWTFTKADWNEALRSSPEGYHDTDPETRAVATLLSLVTPKSFLGMREFLARWGAQPEVTTVQNEKWNAVTKAWVTYDLGPVSVTGTSRPSLPPDEGFTYGRWADMQTVRRGRF